MATTPSLRAPKALGKRSLAAIMFTDVVDSSKLMGDDEEQVMRLLKRDLKVIADLCQQFEGRVLKSMGDGCLAIFGSGVHAVECAQEIQRNFAEQAQNLSPGEVLQHRIGLHLGDVYVTDNDVMGDGVNVAARLQTEAPAGGICLSQALYEVVKNRLALQTVYQGPKQLKNIKEPVHLYQIMAPDHTPPQVSQPPQPGDAQPTSKKDIEEPLPLYQIMAPGETPPQISQPSQTGDIQPTSQPKKKSPWWKKQYQMERETGTLIRWNDDQGYGFIHPHNAKDDIFLHVKTLAPHQRRPKIGDVLTYDVMLDEHDRYYAGAAKIEGLAWSRFTFFWLGIALVFGIYVYFAIRHILPFHPIVIYAAMSLLAIWLYRGDKWAAQVGDWRTPELRLHLVEALGGWPGAFFAQRFYRHKVKKISYQIVFWLIVAGHGVLWYYVLTHPAQYESYKQAASMGIQAVFKKINGATGHPEERTATPRQTTVVPSVRRSVVTPARNARIVAGIVQEVRPDEGVIVSLQTDAGSDGIIQKSTLVNDFARRFKPGEQLQVAIQTITIAGDQQRIELLLVEKE